MSTESKPSYPRVVSTRADLMQVKRQLGVRDDWHEPDNQEVTAEVRGKSFDNAGFYSMRSEAEFLERYGSDNSVEMYVRLSQDGKAVADVPLATLFAWATGFEQGTPEGIDTPQARTLG